MLSRPIFNLEKFPALGLGFLVLCLLMTTLLLSSCGNSESDESQKKPVIESPPDIPPCPVPNQPTASEVSLPSLPPEAPEGLPPEMSKSPYSGESPNELGSEEEIPEEPDPQSVENESEGNESRGEGTPQLAPLSTPSEP